MHLMEQMMPFLNHVSALAAGSLLGAIWEGTVLAAAVALCLHFVKGIAPGVRSVLWTAVLMLVVALHFVPVFGSKGAAEGSAGLVHADPRWSLAIVCLWGVLSLFRAGQLMHSAAGMRRIARRATPVMAPEECAVLLRVGARSAQLCTSSDVDRPSVIGFFSPRVLIPQALFERLSPSELEQIVLHEMEHLRRGDDWTNLIQKLSLMLFPLNPALFWVERRLCVERELACDDRVLQVTKAKKAYATCLVNLAEHSVLRRGASLALGAWEKQTELGRRVRRILRPAEGVMGRRQMTAVAAMLVLGMVGGAVTLAREPQLVSFAPEAHPPVVASASEVRLGPASGFVPATFRENGAAGQAAPKLIDTVFHTPVQSQTARLHATAPRSAETGVVAKASVPYSPRITRRSPAMVNVVARPTAPHRIARRRVSQSSSWVMLTGWTDTQEPPQVRLLVSAPDQPTYAAIRMMNGWLIVQL